MRNRFLALSAFVIAFCCACPSPIFTVGKTENNGVPFYYQEQYDTETYVYEQVFFEVKATRTLQAPTPAAPDKAEKKAAGATPAPTKTPDQDAADSTQAILGYTAKKGDAIGIYTTAINDTDNVKIWKDTGLTIADDLKSGAMTISPPDAASTVSDIKASAMLVSTAVARVQQPTAKPVFLNLSSPFGGSANGEVDLNTDGTLGKAIAQRQDQLPGTVVTGAASVLAAAAGTPLGNLATHFFPPPAKAQDATGATIKRVDLELTPYRRLYTVKYTYLAGTKAECASATPGVRTGNCYLEISSTVVQSGDDAAPKKKDANAIEVSGTITLPDAAAKK